MGNRELLVRCHWLEDAPEPFTIRTDHKNLAYLHEAKCLNSRQTRWALFLGRFDFIVTYQQGSRNTKPDALSRQLVASSPDCSPQPILPPAFIVGAATWRIEERVRKAQRSVQIQEGLYQTPCSSQRLPAPRFNPWPRPHPAPVTPEVLVAVRDP